MTYYNNTDNKLISEMGNARRWSHDPNIAQLPINNRIFPHMLQATVIITSTGIIVSGFIRDTSLQRIRTD